jgi:hypothetical protein
MSNLICALGAQKINQREHITFKIFSGVISLDPLKRERKGEEGGEGREGRKGMDCPPSHFLLKVALQ